MSALAEKLFGGAFPVTLEITPPRERRPAVLLRRAGLLGPRVDAIHVATRCARARSWTGSRS
jgi:hypothetical protein